MVLTEKLLSISTYLRNRKQCVRINGTQSQLGDIISGVPQDQYQARFFNGLFYFILFATAHNFADGNILACIGENIKELTTSLESEYEVVLNWFNENKMTLKKVPDHIDKRKQDHSNDMLKFGFKETKVASRVKLLGEKKIIN